MSLDTSEQIMAQLISLRTVKKAIGVKQASKAVDKDRTDLVFVAEDADARVVAPLCELCASQNVQIERVATMLMLGKYCGIEVGAAAVAVLR
ncbi:MAG: ribosomal L7Ae/L30e/S12e/Gadd45 family protein [Pelosinus sp.]|nr:ribosomal L7Ae/L30e/S12e/Gadd45 family protein [Pelosinus sp.]